MYSYKVRQAAETKSLLIEFLDRPENKDFIKMLIRSFESINVQVVNYQDLWKNDEIVLKASSDIGSFTIYRDAENYYFITSEGNPTTITQLEVLLEINADYKRV